MSTLLLYWFKIARRMGKVEKEAEVNKPLPGSSQPQLLAYNMKLELNWVCCNGKQQAVFMVGYPPYVFSVSKCWAPNSDCGRGSHGSEQKAYHNCGWTKSLLIEMNLAWIRDFSALCLERQGWFDCQVTPTYSANWPTVETCCRWLLSGYFTAWVREFLMKDLTFSFCSSKSLALLYCPIPL